MSDLFNNVKPGDTVHYLTPQGQNGKGKVVMNRGTHVVINRGKGQPQVVNDTNYVKHMRGGKVLGAMLSKVAQYDKNEKAIQKARNDVNMSKGGATVRTEKKRKDNLARLTGESDTSSSGTWEKLSLSAAAGSDEKTRKEIENVRSRRKFGQITKALQKKKVARLKESLLGAIGVGMVAAGAAGIYKNMKPKIAAARKKKFMMKSLENEAKYNTDKATEYVAKTKEANRSKGSKTYSKKAAEKAIFRANRALDAAAKAKGVSEDSHDAEGRAARIAKTKKKLKAKKLHELNTSTLASYVSKAIADRKKAQGGFEIAGRIWDGERKDRAQAKAFKRIDKRSIGIKNAVGKIAKAYEETEVNEARNEYDANAHLAGNAGKTAKGHYLVRDGRRLSGPHSPEDAVKQYKGMSDSKGVKIVKEALSKGHEWYRTKDNIHYKKDGSVYTPTGKSRGASVLPKGRAGYFKGDKFVAIGQEWSGVQKHHVTRVNELTDVTSTLIEAAKVKKAAEKAISLAKKAKGNKHVETKPKLDIADKGTGGPMETNDGENHAKL